MNLLKNKIAVLALAAIAAGFFAVTPATPAAASAPDSVAAALAHLDQLNNQLDQANATLDAANRKLAQDQRTEAALKTEISALAREQYQQPALIVQLFAAGSLSQVLGDISSQQLVSMKERKLLVQARELRRQDQVAQQQSAAADAAAKAARDEARKVADQAIADAAVRARALALAQAAPQAAVPAKWSGAGPWPNHFTYGYCTWYVANRRYVPWFGNAIDWWPNARPYGAAEGQQPRVGAIMVTRESGYGHVAYVEAVNGDGSWTVSEMNFTGWNQVDQRTIRPGQVPLVGFIY